MTYKEIFIPARGELQEILIAELADIGYESFAQEDNGLKAYILSNDYAVEKLEEVVAQYGFSGDQLQVSEPSNINWNEAWEKQYDPIRVADKLYIRASFHEPQSELPEIIIDPKMSFGTGHHATTRLVALSMFERDFRGKKVLDMGCGTGILAILAKKLGAGHVKAVDNFPTAVENSEENALKNGVTDIEFVTGEIEKVAGEHFDIILSNITRNVNKSYLSAYAGMLSKGGIAILSGFFADDEDIIMSEAIKNGFERLHHITEQPWVALTLTRT